MSEHTLYGKKKLCYTEVTEFTDFQGIGRDPLYKRFDSVYSVIEKNIKPQYRDFLAHPIYSDEDQILWYVREWENTPCAYKDLSGADKVKYDKIKQETILAYETVCRNLTGEDRQILTGALKYIDDNFIFCYDNKVVVVAWGMSSETNQHVVKGAVIHDLKIESNHKVRFVAGENGTLSDKLATVVNRPDGAILTHRDLPTVTPKRGYAFKGWEPNPVGMKVNGSLTFTATYNEVPVEEDVKVRVTFMAEDGGSLDGVTEYMLDKGAYIVSSQIPTPVPNAGYSFVGWDKATEAQVNEDVIFVARFNRRSVTCRFFAGGHGTVSGIDSFTMPYGHILGNDRIPVVKARKGYRFVGWDKSPVNTVLDGDKVFTAQYEKKIPWYKRLWMLLTSKGCLKWLLWLLLILLLIFLMSWLLDSCDSKPSRKPVVKKIPRIERPDGKVIDDNGPIKSIIDDDGNLPDNDIVAPIVGDDGYTPPIITHPGAPEIIANRLNIYFEDADADLEQFISDLHKIYPANQCQVIGQDKNVPMIQILIPEEKRDVIRNNLNRQLPDYDFFVVDESIFTIIGSYGAETSSHGWHLDAIDLKEGWEITKGNSDIIVAVVDDGIDASHDLFKERIVKPYNVFTQDNRLSTGDGHGTHVAGLAVGSDRKFNDGVSGVAPNCKLMPIQVFDNGLCTFSSVTNGIMYAIHNGASVVNVSIGPRFNGLDILPLPEQEKIARTQFKNEERVWKRIIEVANKHNVIIVFAAGNDNILANIPPENRTDKTVNVAAVNSEIDKADFTNYGQGSNISAPGQGIYSSLPVNDYGVLDGTSMAAPIVSGTIALMKSLDSEISISEVLHILQATGEVVSTYMPPMIQVDDALIALKTGVIPDSPSSKRRPDNKTDDVTDGSRGAGEDGYNGGKDVNPVPDNRTDDLPVKKGLPVDDEEGDGTDYDAIRRMIEEYKRKINELEKLLPENK